MNHRDYADSFSKKPQRHNDSGRPLRIIPGST